uniref:TMC domain-containing protein n=1 Tax=Arion vulgaris TaxID=1028688 RepID=A0A0B7A772_9EUPU
MDNSSSVNDFKNEQEPSVDYDLEDASKMPFALDAPSLRNNSIDHETNDNNKHSGYYSDDIELLENRNIFHTNSTESNFNGQHQMKHRPRNQILNGFDYYQDLHPRVSNNLQINDSDDNRSIQSLNLEDLRETRKLISTIRLKVAPKLGCAKKYTGTLSRKDAFSDVSINDVDSEEYGLPSMRQKIKGLTERLFLARQQQSTAEVTRQYREAVFSIPSGRLHFYPSSIIQRIKSVSDTCTDVYHHLNFWSQQFKEIEGKCGIATTTYFRFTRWLVKINCMVLLLFLCFIYIPQLTHVFDTMPCLNTSGFEKYSKQMFCCSESYSDHIKNISKYENGWQTFLQIAQGTGILENTMLFYGSYTNLTVGVPTKTGTFEITYNMGLAYLLTVGICFLAVFIMIVKNSSRTIKEAVMDFYNKGFPLYTNAVFSGWDYCINNEKMAHLKKQIIYSELKGHLEEVVSKRQRENRTAKEKAQLYLKRLVINLVVVTLLVGSLYAIYLATEYLLEKQTDKLNDVLQLLISYLPSIVISVLNLVVPEIFLALTELEEYTHSFATHLTVFRVVLLRLASVWVLIGSLYYRLIDEKHENSSPCLQDNIFNDTSLPCCGNTLWGSVREPVKCWESYVGKQFYKLGILDLISVTLVVFLVKLPRKIIFQHFNKFWIIKKIGISKFDLPLEVLDIVYSQTVCWMGMFFMPLLPAITFIKVFIFFFLKKFELLNVTASPQNAYRASRSYSFFQAVLLLSFFVISCLLGYMIGNLQPSMSCGPFRLYSSKDFVMFDVISNEINSWSDEPRNVIEVFGTVAFFLPVFLILVVAMYYHWAIAVGYKKMEVLLKQQLKSEAYDKQYLLARVDEIIKKGQL